MLSTTSASRRLETITRLTCESTFSVPFLQNVKVLWVRLDSCKERHQTRREEKNTKQIHSVLPVWRQSQIETSATRQQHVSNTPTTRPLACCEVSVSPILFTLDFTLGAWAGKPRVTSGFYPWKVRLTVHLGKGHRSKYFIHALVVNRQDGFSPHDPIRTYVP